MFAENIILLSESRQVNHLLKQYPPGTQYVYSYFESESGDFGDGDLEGGQEVVFFGLQYFVKRYLAGAVVTKEKIEDATKFYSKHLGNGNVEGPEHFFKEGWEYILEKHQGHLPIKIKALPEGTVVSSNCVLMTLVNTDPECCWLTSFVESLLSQLWYSCSMCSMCRRVKLQFKSSWLQTGCESLPVAVPNWFLIDHGFRHCPSIEAAALSGLAHLVNYIISDTTVANLYATEYYGQEGPAGFSKATVPPSIVMAWGEDHELDAMRNVLDKHPQDYILSCSSDTIDPVHACRKYWGEELKEQIADRFDLKGARTGKERLGMFYVRLDKPDPEMISDVAKVLLEQYKESSFLSKTGHYILPPFIRLILCGGADHQSIPKILRKLKEENIGTINIRFATGRSFHDSVKPATFNFNFKSSEVVVNGEPRGLGAKPGKLTLEKVDHSGHGHGYKSDGEGGAGGSLHFSNDGKFVTVAEGKGDPARDLLVDIFENGQLLKEFSFGEIRARAELPNGHWCLNPPAYYQS